MSQTAMNQGTVARLELIYGYRLLLAKRDQLHIPLGSAERERLERCAARLERSVPADDERGPGRVHAPLPVQFTIAGGFGSGMLRNLTGGGMAVATSMPPPLGSQVIVLIKEQQHGIEYVFPCRVVSRTLRGRTGMGLAFDGIPSQTRLNNKPSGVWRSDSEPEPDRGSGANG